MKPKILITGGAGYIGSHVAKQLLEQGEEIIILDNLSTGSTKTLETLSLIKPFEFIELDLKEFDKIKAFLSEKSIHTIMHFAASIVVPESVTNPLKYYMNNTVNTTNLIQAAVEAQIPHFIFSSTAAVYGEPATIPIEGVDETFPTQPINPYGMSKLMSETILRDTAKAYPSFKYVIFRYFNVAGADIEAPHPRIGQRFLGATHLIKMASECAIGKRESMSIFGDDYATPDGTGVRDYIHVDDLARAHIDAMYYLKTNESDIFNVGYGKGYSVKEVIQTMRDVTKSPIHAKVTPRRAGDPAMLVANTDKIISKMQWKPQYNNIGLICQSAYLWEKSVD
jgi:UDP-glucose 4-epimerase